MGKLTTWSNGSILDDFSHSTLLFHLWNFWRPLGESRSSWWRWHWSSTVVGKVVKITRYFVPENVHKLPSLVDYFTISWFLAFLLLCIHQDHGEVLAKSLKKMPSSSKVKKARSPTLQKILFYGFQGMKAKRNFGYFFVVSQWFLVQTFLDLCLPLYHGTKVLFKVLKVHMKSFDCQLSKYREKTRM